MNIEELRQGLRAQAKPVTVSEWGKTVYFLPIGAVRGIALHQRIKALADLSGTIDQSPEAFLAFADVISASIADENGNRFLDSDEGRAFLANENGFAVLETLTDHALKVTGIVSEVVDEKNLQTPVQTSA